MPRMIVVDKEENDCWEKCCSQEKEKEKGVRGSIQESNWEKDDKRRERVESVVCLVDW